MSHYFTYDPSLKSNIRTISYKVCDKNIALQSDSGVFSNKEIDKGSLIFINELIDKNLFGKVLDLGCGYGAIGISLSLIYGTKIEVSYADINPKCIELTSRNLSQYDLNGTCTLSDGYENLSENYDFIVFNPPISVGKEKIFKIYEDSVSHLNDNGRLYLVIRKDKGALSHIKYLSTLFKNVEIIHKEKGYFIIECY